MVNDEDRFVLGRSDFPSASQELDGIGRTDPPEKVEGKVEVEHFFLGAGLEFDATFGPRVLPRLVGS